MDPTQLRAALQNGDITFEEFQAAMNRLGFRQGGGLLYPETGLGTEAPVADAGLGVEAAAPAESVQSALSGLAPKEAWAKFMQMLQADPTSARAAVGALSPEEAAAMDSAAPGILSQLGGAGGLLKGVAGDVGIPAAAGGLLGQLGPGITGVNKRIAQAEATGNQPAYSKAMQQKKGEEYGGLGAGVGWGLGTLLAPETGGLSEAVAPLLGSAAGGLLGLVLGHHGSNKLPANNPAAAQAAAATVNTPDQAAWQNLVKLQGQQMQPFVQDMIGQGNAYNSLLQQADQKLPPAIAQMYSAENNLMAAQIHQMADAMGAQSQNAMYQQLLGAIPVKFQAASDLLGSLSSGATGQIVSPATVAAQPATSTSATQQASTS